MLVMWVVFVVALVHVVETEEPIWHLMHQSDYDVKPERMELVEYNHSYFSDFEMKFALYNRTTRAINANITLLKDLANNATMHIQAYKFMSNEYRFFPLTTSFNTCKEYNLNSFEIKTLLDKTSNIRSCPATKGFYYIHNVLPDYSKWPPLIPRGRYKSVIKMCLDSDFLLELHAYGAVVDKPLKWNK